MMTISHAISWGLPQLVFSVLTVLAARRHGLRGLWILSAAAILSLLTKVAITAIMVFSDPIPSGLASLGSGLSLLVFVILVAGLADLAFCHTKQA